MFLGTTYGSVSLVLRFGGVVADETRADAARAAIERVIDEFQDVFVSEAVEGPSMHMPMLACWVLMTTHDDAQDPTLLAAYRMSRKHMATHETAGMLYLALQELNRSAEDD